MKINVQLLKNTIGKTTLAATVVKRLNAHHPDPALAAFVPMDGYHLSRAQLSDLPNPVEAHARRGAEFTFDGTSFLTLVRAIRAQTTNPNSQTLYAPSFDHAIKDPKADDIPILPTTKIIVFEGNYLSLDKKPWSTAAALMDELWFVEVDFEVARRRLVGRHVTTGVTPTAEEAERRVSKNDLVNGEEIVRYRIKNVDEVIVSREDDAWKPEAQGE
jgi:pantothenate kinase